MLKDRVKLVREALGLTQKDAAAGVGVGLRTWQQYEDGTHDVGWRVAVCLCEMGCNLNWLATGEGPMMRGEAGENVEEDSDLMFFVTSKVLRKLAGWPHMPDPEKVLKLIKLIHDDIREEEMSEAETDKNIERILKIVA